MFSKQIYAVMHNRTKMGLDWMTEVNVAPSFLGKWTFISQTETFGRGQKYVRNLFLSLSFYPVP